MNVPAQNWPKIRPTIIPHFQPQPYSFFFQHFTPCNRNSTSTINGKCIYNTECRKSMVIHEAKCKTCNMLYIGNTQHKLKVRMTQHFKEVKDLVKLGKTSNTLAHHFAQHIDPKMGPYISTANIHSMVSMKVLWQGNPRSCMKTFCTNACTLCMKERLECLKNPGKTTTYS